MKDILRRSEDVSKRNLFGYHDLLFIGWGRDTIPIPYLFRDFEGNAGFQNKALGLCRGASSTSDAGR
jgi:hypothetical protein